MKLVLKLKLRTDESTAQMLSQTCEAYRTVCNRLSEMAFTHRVFTKYDLHHLAYYAIRAEFELPAQLIVRSISEVCNSYAALAAQIKEHNTCCQPQDRRELTRIEFHADVAVPYDARVLAVDADKRRVSIRSLSKHIHLNFDVGDKRAHLLTYIKGQADLKRHGKKWYLLQTMEIPETEPVATTNVIGVDSGIVTVASSTDGCETLRFSGSRIRRKRSHHYQLRRGLQRHNTKSSRRRVRKMRDKESRVARDYNHLVSRRIVEQAERTNSLIALENLDGLHAGAKVTRGQRRERFSWAYAQLIGFIVYKAQLAGIPVVFVARLYFENVFQVPLHARRESGHTSLV